MRIFKTRAFSRFADKKSITDDALIKLIKRANKGLIDADLGNNVIKQRLAKQGQGKSSGYRIILYKIRQYHYFVAAFEKNTRGNITKSEEIALKQLANLYLTYSDEIIQQQIDSGILIEIPLPVLENNDEIQ